MLNFTQGLKIVTMVNYKKYFFAIVICGVLELKSQLVDREAIINKCASELFEYAYDDRLKEEDIDKKLKEICSTFFQYRIGAGLILGIRGAGLMEEIKKECDDAIQYSKDRIDGKFNARLIVPATLCTLGGLIGLKFTRSLYAKYKAYKSEYDDLMTDFKSSGIRIEKRSVGQIIYHDMLLPKGFVGALPYGSHARYMKLYDGVGTYLGGSLFLGGASAVSLLVGMTQLYTSLILDTKERHKKRYPRLLVIKEKLHHFKIAP